MRPFVDDRSTDFALRDGCIREYDRFLESTGRYLCPSMYLNVPAKLSIVDCGLRMDDVFAGKFPRDSVEIALRSPDIEPSSLEAKRPYGLSIL